MEVNLYHILFTITASITVVSLCFSKKTIIKKSSKVVFYEETKIVKLYALVLCANIIFLNNFLIILTSLIFMLAIERVYRNE